MNDTDLSIIEHTNGNVQFKLRGNHTMKSIEILDLLGRTLYKMPVNSNDSVFKLSGLSQATYIAKVTLDNGYVITKKAVKRR